MSVRNWHWGKLVILWGWGAALVLLSLEGLRRTNDNFVFGTFLLLLLLAIPAGLSVVTWKWLAGKESIG